MRKLGPVQRDVLDALRRFTCWSPGHCGWLWNNESGTKRIMDSLVRAGHVKVRKEETPRGRRLVYRPVRP